MWPSGNRSALQENPNKNYSLLVTTIIVSWFHVIRSYLWQWPRISLRSWMDRGVQASASQKEIMKTICCEDFGTSGRTSATTSSERRAFGTSHPMPSIQNKLLPWQYRILEAILLWHSFSVNAQVNQTQEVVKEDLSELKLFLLEIHLMINYYKAIGYRDRTGSISFREVSNHVSPEMSAQDCFCGTFPFYVRSWGALDKWYLG